MSSYILRIDCPDQKGLIHKVTGVLFRHGLNIITNHEFVDHKRDRFFMRTEFPAARLNARRIMGEIQRKLPAGTNVAVIRHRKKNIVIMATKESHCLGDLLIRHAEGELAARIQAVISNHPVLRKLTSKFSIPYHFLSDRGVTREKHEALILHVLRRYRPEYIVMARYMRILTPGFISKYENRILNIHHSFLPAFIGQNPYRQAFERGVKIIGATAHFASRDLDEGAIIAQSVIPVDHTHSVEDMTQAGRDIEKIVLARALRLILEDRVFVSGNKTVVFD